MDSTVAVALVVGKGRSGSTILGDVLGSAHGVFHAGELWRLWSEGITGRHSCSCGRSVTECPTWSRVLNYAGDVPAGRRAIEDPQRFSGEISRLYTFGGLGRSVLQPSKRKAAADEIRAVMAVVYRAISFATKAFLIVDTSKWPLDPMLLRPEADIHTFGVHLVRDPRAVASSWQKTKHFPDTREAMPTFSPLHTSASWTARNLAAEWAGRRIGDRMLHVTYEGFVASPQTTVDTVFAHTGHPGVGSNLFHDESWIDIAQGHTIMGNPSRFEHGAMQITPQPDPPPEDHRIVRILTWPLRRRYGYVN